MAARGLFRGLFVGLVTLDLIYLVQQLPDRNQKIVAQDYTVAAGGPATNAAVTFGYLGGAPKLVTVLGNSAIVPLIQSDLATWGVTIVDLKPDCPQAPSVSSVLVTQTTGDRAVISQNAVKTQASPAQIPPIVQQTLELGDTEVVLIDGHQMQVSAAIAQQAKAQGIPVVIDGGSWKPGFETVLPWVDYAVCSANFWPPACRSRTETIAYLQAFGIEQIAITHGRDEIVVVDGAALTHIPVPQVSTIDTLGAGDIFHGVFCHAILRDGFRDALASAAQIAAISCQSFGTRQWMHDRVV